MEIPQARPIHFWLSFSALVTGLVVNGVFGYLNWQERAEMRQEQRMARTMLDARARIQMMLIDAAKQGRQLTPEEVRIIDRLYVPAEYDHVEKK